MKIARFIFFIAGFLLIVTGSILLCNSNKSMGMITVKAGLGISFAGVFVRRMELRKALKKREEQIRYN